MARDSRGGGRSRHQHQDDRPQFVETVVKINRCAKVMKGGRRFSFSALVVVGDHNGRVGVGFGKANEVPPAVEKAVKKGRDTLTRVPVVHGTIPHEITGRFGASRVKMVPASEGTGVIAGAAVRAVVEAAGIHNLLTKVYGSTNPLNVVKATFEGLKSLLTKEECERLRGVSLK